MGSIPGLGGSPGERNDNPLLYSCLVNHMDSGVWWATVQRDYVCTMLGEITHKL